MRSRTRREKGLLRAAAALPLLALAGCGTPTPCCEPSPYEESLAAVRDAELTPLAVAEAAPLARVGRVDGVAAQAVMEFRGLLTGPRGGGTFVDEATLAFFVSGVVGVPGAEFGDLRVELVAPPDPPGSGSGLGDPISELDFDDSAGATLFVTDVSVPAGGGLVRVDVTPAVQAHAAGEIGFRILFVGASSAGPDAYVSIATSEAADGPPPMLDVRGGFVGL
jgi:hypothetical protein